MKSANIPVLWLIFLLFVSCGSAQKENEEAFQADADYIQIVMFHLEQRCESCNAVELQTLALLEEEYDEEVASGKVKFIPLGFQSDNGRKTAELLRASGQTLYVVKGDSISDLTSAAFMFALTHPERYRTALKKELDLFLE